MHSDFQHMFAILKEHSISVILVGLKGKKFWKAENYTLESCSYVLFFDHQFADWSEPTHRPHLSSANLFTSACFYLILSFCLYMFTQREGHCSCFCGSVIQCGFLCLLHSVLFSTKRFTSLEIVSHLLGKRVPWTSASLPTLQVSCWLGRERILIPGVIQSL